MPRRPSKPSEESFLKDVAEHTVSIRMDNGVYRHLFCRKPGTGVNHFEIVTWPGTLAYTGDMGSFVFSRVEDMFTFFRGGDTGELRINPGYWSEKLEAVDSARYHPGHSEFSPERFREHVEEVVADWCEDLTPAQQAELRAAIENDVLRYLDDGEHAARQAVTDFECRLGEDPRCAMDIREYLDKISVPDNRPHFQFADTFEWDCTTFTYHFLWCCYALVWAIRQYDALTAPAGTEGVLA